MPDQVVVTLSLTDPQALALAQFVKRCGWIEWRENAVDHDEAYRMLAVGEKVRSALADAGYAPR